MRIAIVNDLPMAVEALRRAVMLQPGNRIAWIARQGAEAVELCAKDTPDLILMDLLMPVMDGAEATRRIMAATPCAILVVTVSMGANAWRVFDAMGHGALDAVDTPALGQGNPRESAAQLLAKIEIIGRLITDTGWSADHVYRGGSRPPMPFRGFPLVAIGASAGGPAALAAVLRGLPRTYPAAVVIVQHIDRHFAPSMTDWLKQYSHMPVRLVEEGDRLAAGTVWVACTNDHLTLKSSDQLGYTPDPREYVYRPSVDVFFQSVMHYWPGAVAGVLLTGMGRDGAIGLKTLRNKGHHTIAQDQATSAVYGMPKAAATLDAAVEILPLEQIAPQLTRLFPAPVA